MGMKISDLLARGQNQDAEWLDYGGLRLLIAPISNRRFDEDVAESNRKDRRARRRAALGSTADVLEMTMGAASRTILVGWEGLEDDKGCAIPYSPGKALELFKANYQFYKDVMAFAADLAQERAETIEADTGNSPPPCDGV